MHETTPTAAEILRATMPEDQRLRLDAWRDRVGPDEALQEMNEAKMKLEAFRQEVDDFVKDPRSASAAISRTFKDWKVTNYLRDYFELSEGFRGRAELCMKYQDAGPIYMTSLKHWGPRILDHSDLEKRKRDQLLILAANARAFGLTHIHILAKSDNGGIHRRAWGPNRVADFFQEFQVRKEEFELLLDMRKGLDEEAFQSILKNQGRR